MSLLYNKKMFRVLVVLTGLYNLYYIWWRATYTMNEAALIFSIILLLAEIQGVINYYLYAMMTWNTDDMPMPKLFTGASVDVFVPTYNEDIKVLEATLVGCNRMRYPHKTWLLDDGNRPAVKELADKMSCGYIFRTKNKHGKAGNINEAMPKTSGDYIVILDADTVPQPDFLERTIGYFADPKIAIVQLPQEFYNLDSMQHNRQHGKHEKETRWHEQQLFYHVIQPGKNQINATFWCGSPSVVRRAALLDVGGVATDVVTEDFLTSIRLNAKGWKIRYHHETLAFGIAPQSYHAFNVQRLRWAQGSMKIFMSRDNPLIKRGLSIKQRLSHFAAIFTYFDSYQKLIFFLAPAVFLLTGILPITHVSGFDFMAHWLPYIALTMLTTAAFGRGYFKTFEVEKFNTLKMVTFIKASLTFFLPKRNIFRVTPKTTDNSANRMDRRELKIHMAILMLIAVSMLFALANAIWSLFFAYSTPLVVAMALFWSCYNGYILILALRDVGRRLYARQDYRFPVGLEARIVEGDKRCSARVADISRGGISLFHITADCNGTAATVEIALPDGVLSLRGSVTYVRTAEDGTHDVGMRFDEIPDEPRERLYNYLYVTLPRIIYDREQQTRAEGTECAGSPTRRVCAMPEPAVVKKL